MKAKRIVFIAASMILCFLTLIGCGKKEENNTVQTVLKDNIELENEEKIEDLNEETEEIIPEEPIKYSCMDEIKNADPDSGKIQIDDMIFQYGAKFSEVIDIIEQSEDSYIAEYNEASIVPAGESERISFKKNEKTYFSITFKNYESETVELRNCVAWIISIGVESKGNAYYAGFDNDEMNYNLVKTAMKNYEPENEMFGYDAKGNKRLAVSYIIPTKENDLYIYFIFDNVTNELNSFLVCNYKFTTVSLPW